MTETQSTRGTSTNTAILLSYALAYTASAVIAKAAWWSASRENDLIAWGMMLTYERAAGWISDAIASHVAYGTDPITALRDRRVTEERDRIYLDRVIASIAPAIAAGVRLAKEPQVAPAGDLPPYGQVLREMESLPAVLTN